MAWLFNDENSSGASWLSKDPPSLLTEGETPEQVISRLENSLSESQEEKKQAVLREKALKSAGGAWHRRPAPPSRALRSLM